MLPDLEQALARAYNEIPQKIFHLCECSLKEINISEGKCTLTFRTSEDVKKFKDVFENVLKAYSTIPTPKENQIILSAALTDILRKLELHEHYTVLEPAIAESALQEQYASASQPKPKQPYILTLQKEHLTALLEILMLPPTLLPTLPCKELDTFAIVIKEKIPHLLKIKNNEVTEVTIKPNLADRSQDTLTIYFASDRTRQLMQKNLADHTKSPHTLAHKSYLSSPLSRSGFSM